MVEESTLNAVIVITWRLGKNKFNDQKKDIMFKFFVIFSLLVLPYTASGHQEGQWVKSNAVNCLATCDKVNLKPLQTDVVTGADNPHNGRPYYVCRAEAEGKRAGMNIGPHGPINDWANICITNIASRSTFECYCK